jgi:archaemetzincin
MNGSNSLAETDAAPAHLCPVCLRKLQFAVQFDPMVRYRELSAGIVPRAFLPAASVFCCQPS